MATWRNAQLWASDEGGIICPLCDLNIAGELDTLGAAADLVVAHLAKCPERSVIQGQAVVAPQLHPDPWGDVIPATPGNTDQEALADRIRTGCLYPGALCPCPSLPYRYDGCKVRADARPFEVLDQPPGHVVPGANGAPDRYERNN